LIIFAGDALYGLSPDTGTTLWREPWKTEYDVNAAIPVYRDGRLLVASGYGSGALMMQLGMTSAKPLWRNREIATRFNAPILDGESLYVNAEGTLSGFRWSDGERLWTKDGLRLGMGGSLVRTGDLLVAWSERGQLTLLRATPAGATVISQSDVVRGDHNWSTPLLYRGKLYVRGPRELLCLDWLSDEQAAPRQ
jgi:hypothetical protein